MERNTGTAADFAQPGGTTFAADVSVVDKELLVNANVTLGDTTAVAFGERRELFTIEVSNVSALDDADVSVVSFVALLRGGDGALLNPQSVFDINRSALFNAQGKAVAILRTENDSLFLDMTPNTLPVGASATYRFAAQFAEKSAVRTFSLATPVAGMTLKVTSGPRNGAVFNAQHPAGAPPFQSKEYTLTSAVFAESFQPQNNPFNPFDGPTQFSYTLAKDSDIELAIYTLTGKLVRRYSFSAGAQYGSAGVQTPSWDGRNGDGALVRDGVYVVALTNLTTGEKAYLKQAVLK